MTEFQSQREGVAETGPAPRILIVDDISDNRAILARRFQRRGYEVLEADGGGVALEMIAREPFDCVLLDVMMGDWDGRDVLRRIRESHAPAALPVIMATAKTQSEDVVEALNLGANDYITKPVDFAVALARVETQIGRKRAEEQVRNANRDLERKIAERTIELREANERLQGAVETAEAANRAKDEFLTNMSHELRTPLNGVIGMAQMLRTTGLTPAQLKLLDVIDASGEALQTVVTDLLDLVELGSGGVLLNPQPLVLSDLMREVAAPIQARAEQKGLTFVLAQAAEAAGVVEVDPARLRQMLGNVLDNAVKFTDQGRIALSVFRSPSAPDRVVFEVADTGVGFDPALTERLFQRFQQADGSRTRRHGGAGVGLAICRELVAQMGGTVSAEGRPGAGATFRIELPLPERRAAA